jgi:Leucine-rich repeat (LRR) protein
VFPRTLTLILQNTCLTRVPNSGRFGNVQVLDLSNNPRLEHFKELEGFTKVKDLRVNGCNLSRGFSNFFSEAFLLAHLTDLQLRDNNFTELGWVPLWTHLRALDVSRNTFGNILNFGSKFKPNEKLVELRLDNTGVTQIHPLDRFEGLEILSLSNNPGLTGLKILNNLSKLHTLSVRNCGLGGSLREVFTNLWSLHDLKASGNNIDWPESEADIRQIFPVIQKIEK